MGGCQGNKVIEVESIPSKKKPHFTRSRSKKGSRVSHRPEEEKELFPDMKEWKGERYSGIGIKRMKGYKCSLPIDKLNEKRNEFWSTVDNHSHPHYQIWRIINQACLYDECKYEYI